MRTGRDIRKKPVSACAVCGASLHGTTETACPSCGASLDDTRAYRDNLEGYAVERAPYHNYKPPEAHRIA